MGQKFYLESVDIKCTYFKVRRWNFKTVFFKRHTDDDLLSTVPPKLKSFAGGESTPVIADALGGRFSVRNSEVREKKIVFSLNVWSNM